MTSLTKRGNTLHHNLDSAFKIKGMKGNSNDDGEWGGAWTEKKLAAFSKYVSSYLKILKANPQWKTIYFDGFAGSGTRKGKKSDLYNQLSLTKEDEGIYKGAAERVLSLGNGLLFNYHYFIDNEKALKKLEEKLLQLECSKNTKLIFRPGDSNHWLSELAKALKTGKYAALILLDPFGMQINWDSITKLKGTRSDVWILVPTGVIVNRLLYKSGNLKHINKLQSFFGLTEEEIKREFYQTEQKLNLFGEEDEVVTKVIKPINHIMRLYIKQLKTLWKHVTEEPLRLDNTKGRPLFHLVFASNEPVAIKIAKDIIRTK